MADNTTLNPGVGGDTIASEDIAGVKIQRVKLALGDVDTDDGDIASGNPIPVSDDGGSLTVDGPLTDAQLRATAVPVSGTVTTGGLTDTQLRATAVPVSGPLTDTQLRATAVPVSGTVTASGPLTDTQLRATPVPIEGVIEITTPNPIAVIQSDGANSTLGTQADAKSTATDTTPITVMQVLKQISASVQAPPAQAVTGPLTDTQLRAVAVPVSAASLPLPSGAATETTLGGVLTTSDFDTKTGALTETAPATDTASSGLNGRLQRIAQRITSLITALGSPFQAGGSIGNTTFASTQSGTWTVQPGNTANSTAWKVDGSAVTQPVSGTVTATPTGTYTTKETRAATPAQSSVANSASSVTVLASNSNRLGATIFNDDTAGTGATLKVKLGATASASSFTVAIEPQGYYEVPFNYTGIIDGIASAATGNARITELTA